MVRKTKTKKEKPKEEYLDLNTVEDKSKALNYWFNLIGVPKEYKELFKGCTTKEEILRKFYELIMDKHDLIVQLEKCRKKVYEFVVKADMKVNFTIGSEVHKRSIDIQRCLKTQTPIGYWETLKIMQAMILSKYLHEGWEEQLPDYNDVDSDFMPKDLGL